MSDTKTGGTQADIKLTLHPMPMKKWRCSRGHKWESPVRVVGIEFQGYADIGIPAADFCMLCLYERCAEGLGKVREDT